MKLINNILAFFIIAGIVSSCSDFGDMNINPDAPTSAEPSFLITNTIYKIGDQTAVNGFEYSGTMTQAFGKWDFNTIDHYNIESNTSVWVNNYKLLGDLNDVLSSDKANPSMKAVAKILKAYIGAQLTNLYGHVPFSEAANKDNLTPKYDTQEEIYTATNGVLDLLDQAISELNADTGAITGDVLFNGDKERWVTLSNVLKLKYLLRISDQYASAGSKIQAIVSSGDLFSSDTDNATLFYGQEPNNWFLSTVRDGDFNLYSMTNSVKIMFEDRADPRISFYYGLNSDGSFVGLEPGTFDRPDPEIPELNYSLLSLNLRASDVMNMVFATYYQQEFILAEAALKGYISSSAETHYNNAVNAAFTYRNINIPADYLSNPAKGAWDGTLENLITQKYLANLMVGYENWFDYRRTGFPVLSASLNNINSDQIPIRFKYPTEESFTNSQNYNQAVTAMGTDSYNVSAWWD